MVDPGSRRFVALDGVRGVAALYVVLFHVNWQTHLSGSAFAQNGYLAVDLFFILSGLVIATTYAGRIRSARDFLRFMLRRVFRVYPLHLATLLAFLALEVARAAWVALGHPSGGPAPFSGERGLDLLVANLFLLHGIGFTPQLGWNSPSWSISCELVAYVVFGLTALAGVTRRVIHPIIAFAAMGLLYWPIATGLFGPFAGLARCFAGFTMGTAIAAIIVAPSWRRLMAGMPPAQWTAVQVALTSVAVAAILLLRGPAGYAVVPIFGLLVMCLQSDRGPVARALGSKAPQFLGRVSYSTYMVHVLTIIPFTALLKRLPGVADFVPTEDGRLMMLANPYLGDIMLAALIAAVLLVSRWSYDWVEEPGRIFGRRFGDAPSGAETSAASEVHASTPPDTRNSRGRR